MGKLTIHGHGFNSYVNVYQRVLDTSSFRHFSMLKPVDSPNASQLSLRSGAKMNFEQEEYQPGWNQRNSHTKMVKQTALKMVNLTDWSRKY